MMARVWLSLANMATIEPSRDGQLWDVAEQLKDIPTYASAVGPTYAQGITDFFAGADHCGNAMVFGVGPGVFSALAR
jgi:hypothetical protein